MADNNLANALRGNGSYSGGGGLESKVDSDHLGLEGKTADGGFDSLIDDDPLNPRNNDFGAELKGANTGVSGSSNSNGGSKQNGITKKSANDILQDDDRRRREAFNKQQREKAKQEQRLKNYKNRVQNGGASTSGLENKLKSERLADASQGKPSASSVLNGDNNPWDKLEQKQKDADSLGKSTSLDDALKQQRSPKGGAQISGSPQQGLTKGSQKVNGITKQQGPVNNLSGNNPIRDGKAITAQDLSANAPAMSKEEPSAVAPGEVGTAKGNASGKGSGKTEKSKGIVKGAGKLGLKTAKGTVKLSGKLLRKILLWIGLTNIITVVVIFFLVLVGGAAVILMANVEPFRGQLKAANMLGDTKIVTLPKSMLGNIAGGTTDATDDASADSKSKSKDDSDSSSGSGADLSGNSVVSPAKAKKMVWKLLQAEGYSKAATAGIMGNMQAESNFNTKVVNSSSGAFGLAQWLGGRKTNLQNYAKKHKQSVNSVEAQVGFLIHETKDAYYGNKLKPGSSFSKATDPKTACMTWYNVFERGGASQVGDRATYAEAIYKEMK